VSSTSRILGDGGRAAGLTRLVPEQARDVPMLKIASGLDLYCNRSKRLVRLILNVAFAAGVLLVAVDEPARAQVSVQAPSSATAKIPELASAEFAWLALGVDLARPAGTSRLP